MKQKLIIFAMMFALATICASAQPKHRHHAAAVVVTDSASIAPTDDADEGIEAYSDTTSVDDDVLDDDQAVTTTVHVSHDSSEYDDLLSWLESFSFKSLGVLGGTFAVLVAILAVLFVLLLLFSPLIVIILVMRYLVRQHNDRVTLAEKAMETGQPIPEELMPMDKQSDEYLRRRGIRNIWIGIGMAIMFGIWGSTTLEGVGFLVLCYGIGQVLIARSSMRKNKGDDGLSQQ